MTSPNTNKSTGSNSDSSAIPLLEIVDLHVNVEDKEILKGVNLTINAGEIHAIMGRNGSGKSTLSYALMGHPRYKVTSGKMLYKGQEISEMSPDQRAKLGLALAFQYPVSIPGVSVSNFLRKTVNAVRGRDIPVKEFRLELKALMAKLGVKDEFLSRYVNDGFSGGEKKRLEILQLSMLNPSLAILDETDSGLDIDALKTVSEGVNALSKADTAILLITHYQRMLNYVQPQFVHVFQDGKIVASGGSELALELEDRGYEWVTSEMQPTPGTGPNATKTSSSSSSPSPAVVGAK
ncbi:MAG: transporter protein [Cyanobacteriota bacterium erpe_2018_sw_21hr_WHONDRS-SW48-000092_B_bin.40]|jgi:Fe-S cluster assembly ATP-binding protein|nr:transporter protein [Cyanobacteriota bacterium erpe_2018_sw_21hr_WHONDRS-SW48-000092_B_bin.40]